MTIPLTSHPRLAAFVLSEADGQRSRENIVVTKGSNDIKSGTVLSKGAAIASAGRFSMDDSATGNPTSGTITVGTGATPGLYHGTFTSATAFGVTAPDGTALGAGAVGTAYSKGGLTLTLTAGSTAAVAGDTFTIAVTAAASKYAPYDGTKDAAAILYSHVPAGTGDVEVVGFVRDCEVNRNALIGLDNKAEADLTGAGIRVRGVPDSIGIHTPAL